MSDSTINLIVMRFGSYEDINNSYLIYSSLSEHKPISKKVAFRSFTEYLLRSYIIECECDTLLCCKDAVGNYCSNCGRKIKRPFQWDQFINFINRISTSTIDTYPDNNANNPFQWELKYVPTPKENSIIIEYSAEIMICLDILKAHPELEGFKFHFTCVNSFHKQYSEILDESC